MIIPAEMVILL